MQHSVITLEDFIEVGRGQSQKHSFPYFTRQSLCSKALQTLSKLYLIWVPTPYAMKVQENTRGFYFIKISKRPLIQKVS